MANSANQHGEVWPESRRRTQGFGRHLSGAQSALRSCRHEEAIAHARAALLSPRLRPDQEAAACCLLAEAWENLARFTEAVQALEVFEKDETRLRLSPSMQAQVCLRLGSACGGTTEIPRAIAFAKQALTLALQQNEPVTAARAHLLLGTLFRRLGELWFARDHLTQVTREAATHNDRQLTAQAWNGLSIIHTLEAEWDKAREASLLGLESLGDEDAPLIRGSLDVNLAAVAALQGRMRESVELLERALPQLERSRHPRLIVNARSNLGYSLLRLGELQRARDVLEQALSEARACEALLIAASTMETLGELSYLQGEFAVAEKLIEESLAIIRGIRVSFNEAMALLTRGRCLLHAERAAAAAESFRLSLEISERMGDPRGQVAAKLCLVEAHLALGETIAAQHLLAEAGAEAEQLANTPLIGQLREVAGCLALATGAMPEAIRSLNQALSIWEVLEDRYRRAVTLARLGDAYTRCGDSARARAALTQARRIFQKLNARPMMAWTEAALKAVPEEAAAEAAARVQATDPVSVITRLIEAGFSRELLLHELSRMLHDDFGISPVIVFRQVAGESPEPLSFRGGDEQQARSLSRHVSVQGGSSADEEIHPLFTGDDGILWLYLGRRGANLPDALIALIRKQVRLALERCQIVQRTTRLTAPAAPATGGFHFALPGLIYRSEAMRRVVEQVISLRSSNITVLITGETGTGKELIARAIHAFSARAAAPFIPFNCASAPRELIESQLFGHRRGAFTGATADFPGVIGAAEKGTLFLDEIGELAREMQPKLLRFLQYGEIHRLGEATPRIANVRVIAATNRDLEEMVTAGDFRADLYYRLNVIQLHLPPLRARREEIPLLAEHFLARYSAEAEKPGITLAPSVMTLLKQYDWPGNTRQLENEIQRLVALAPADARVTPDLLSPHISSLTRLRLLAPTAGLSRKQTLAEAVAETERQLISEALLRHKGNISKVAAELGVSRHGLRNMLRRHHLAARHNTGS
jgi:DNA-binding NtrC family response regulator/tetratricopeptide (TPR) repeat protein